MSAEERVAEAPFDNARADLILRSKDEEPMLFRVYKSILSMASPVFADMFTLPSEGPSGVIQVVDLPENSETLDLALRHICPVTSPNVSQLHQMYLLAEFARKYQVDALDRCYIRLQGYWGTGHPVIPKRYIFPSGVSVCEIRTRETVLGSPQVSC
jgi:hypothetical protein